MKGDPGQRQPSRPVSAKEHEDPAHNRQQTDKGDPNQLGLDGLRYFEVGEVISKAEGPGRDEKATDDQDGNRTFFHKFLDVQQPSRIALSIQQSAFSP